MKRRGMYNYSKIPRISLFRRGSYPPAELLQLFHPIPGSKAYLRNRKGCALSPVVHHAFDSDCAHLFPLGDDKRGLYP